MPGPVAVRVTLSDDEREQLQAWARRPKSAQALAMRARIVLGCEGDSSNTQIARELGVTRGMVTKWRNRFAVDRLDGLLDEPRPGRPRVVEDAQIEELITATLETAPRDATQWSTRSMAEHLGLSQSMVSRVWRAFGLAPHKQDSWKLSKDPLFVAKVRDVVGLYLNPPERAMVLCVDEKTQIQALNRTAPVFPMLPGTPARASHDYVRHGTSSLYAALDLSTGKVIGALPPFCRAVFGIYCRPINYRLCTDHRSNADHCQSGTPPKPSRIAVVDSVSRGGTSGWPRDALRARVVAPDGVFNGWHGQKPSPSPAGIPRTTWPGRG
ncbi:MAG: hypothetical protein QOJ66_3734 [Ilumatobacteraceae bacterium]